MRLVYKLMYHICQRFDQHLYYSALGLPRCCEVGFTQRLYIISTVVRLVSPNGYILFHSREVGFTRRFIIIIITTTPFDVEGREVGYPTIMMGIWYGTLLVSE